MSADPHADEYRRALVDYAGGYLRNTLWSSPITCTYCAGIPGSPEHATCYPCGWQYQATSETSDRRGFVTYAWPGSQSEAVMYGYKERTPNPQATRVVRLMLGYALYRHFRCTADPTHGTPTMWATVPSLKQRGHPQALHEFAASLLKNMPEAPVAPSADVRNPRTYRPENFAVTTDVTNAHILLLDDTWVSGAHAESTSAALKRAGAASVTVLVLARWLDTARGVTGDFIKTELRDDFEPDRCPFGDGCV